MEKTFLRVLLAKVSLTDQLLKLVDDYEIYSTLIGEDMELGEVINSPIRSSDECPSFAVFVPTKIPWVRPDELWFKDLADGRRGNVFRFAKYYAMHHFGLKLEGRFEIIKFIDSQLELGLFDEDGPKAERVAVKRQYEKRELKDIRYKSRAYTPKDLEFWAKLEQDREDLEFWNVKSVRFLINEEGVVRKSFRRNELAFVYPIWDKCKLYQPEASRSFKFRNTCPGDDHRYYQGYQQLRLTDGPEILIITKSMKDVMVFHKFFNNYLGIPVDVIAPHAESINLSEDFVKGVKHHYKTILCVSDFDLAGVKFARQCRDLGFHYKFVDDKRTRINGKYKVIDKDVSDFLTNHGRDKTEKLLKSWKIDSI